MRVLAGGWGWEAKDGRNSLPPRRPTWQGRICPTAFNNSRTISAPAAKDDQVCSFLLHETRDSNAIFGRSCSSNSPDCFTLNFQLARDVFSHVSGGYQEFDSIISAL